jgi:hypothetical protein
MRSRDSRRDRLFQTNLEQRAGIRMGTASGTPEAALAVIEHSAPAIGAYIACILRPTATTRSDAAEPSGWPP